MTVAAVIPMHTPHEAIAELDYAVRTLGSKVVVLPSYVERPIPAAQHRHAELGREIEWIDVLALDSVYDYDPVWQRCQELGVAVTTHSGSHGLGFRRSISNFMYNHIGHFSEAGEAFAKALFFGGVTRRFPNLNFAFLEQGVVRGVALYAGLIERWNKRGGPHIFQYDPQRIDWETFDKLVDRFAANGMNTGAAYEFLHHPTDQHPEELDDFARCEIEDANQIQDLFVRPFYFGCEADDRMTCLAFDTNLNPGGVRLNAILSSDLSHWDVPDMRKVIEEAYELVEGGLMTPSDFRAFSCDNVIRLHTQTNPDFFKATIVESYVDDQFRGSSANRESADA